MHGDRLLRRLMNLPLVCKRWSRILGQPSAAWEITEIEFNEVHGHGSEREDGLPLLDANLVSAWFSRSTTFLQMVMIFKPNSVQPPITSLDDYRPCRSGVPTACGGYPYGTSRTVKSCQA